MSSELYVGLMSGTSADGLDTCLVSINPDNTLEIIANSSTTFKDDFKQEIKQLCKPGHNEITLSRKLGIKLSRIAAAEINNLLESLEITSEQVKAIGFHGQTIRHLPTGDTPFSVQAGCGSTLAHLTKIDVITDFRMADIAAGGQGAPLVPAFHQAVFSSETANRVIVNIGGIANITFIHANKKLPTFGFDTGPGNTLMDEWIQTQLKKDFDLNGHWAQQGSIIPELLEKMLREPYLAKAHPKSTGKELFNLEWLNNFDGNLHQHPAENVQRTLLEYTCETIAREITPLIKSETASTEIYLCGGGAFNQILLKRIKDRLAPLFVSTTADLGINPQSVESSAFAWLAFRTRSRLNGNLMSVTGAKQEKILGCIYPA